MFSTWGRWRRFAGHDPRVRTRATTSIAQRVRVALVATSIAVAAALTVAGPAQAATIAAGENHTCTIRGAEGIFCWGANSDGQLGTANQKTYLYRIRTKLSSNVKAITAGYTHTCAVRRNGTVYCWGYNSVGQLGVGDNSSRSTMTQVPGISDAVDISAGENHTCALRATGTVSCWGYNHRDQLGNRSALPTSTSPLPVLNVTDAVAIAAGGDHTCVVRSSGTVRCWGSNLEGELGNGSQSVSRPLAQPVNLKTAVGIAAGKNHTCVLHKAGTENSGTVRTAGTVSCWGRNADYEAAPHYEASVLSPTRVLDLSGVTSLGAGGHHSCALVGTGTIKCWGRNIEGELGNGKTAAASPVTQTLRITTGTEIAAGGRHTCALRANLNLLCWGGNGGQLGFGPSPDKDFTQPMKVHALPDPTPFF